jgi:hypothetical protein
VLSGLLVAVSLLGSCAVNDPPTIQSSTGNAAGTRAVALISSDGDEGLRSVFQDHLRYAFRERGVPSQTEAPVLGDFAIAVLPAEVSIATAKTLDTASASSSVASEPSRPDLIVKSAPRKDRLLDNCDAVRYRASLVLFDRESGNRLHRAEGEAAGCATDAVPLAKLADLLVRDALLAPQ